MLQWIKNFFSRLVLQEPCAYKLARSFCIGNYIAFSPFIGFHGLMAIVFSWVLSLNFTVTFATTYFVNNFWTAIPVYMADYLFGHWLVHDVLQCDVTAITPLWMVSLSEFCAQKLGLKSLCFWSFLIGGNILGIIISVALYPGMRTLFKNLLQHKDENISTK